MRLVDGWKGSGCFDVVDNFLNFVANHRDDCNSTPFSAIRVIVDGSIGDVKWREKCSHSPFMSSEVFSKIVESLFLMLLVFPVNVFLFSFKNVHELTIEDFSRRFSQFIS